MNIVYPYHSRGQEAGKLKSLVEEMRSATDVRLRDWHQRS